jgi:hypothetical protein
MDDIVLIDYIRAVLAQAEAGNAAIEARARELEASGHRIISGARTTPYGHDGKCGWEITDWRSGEILAKGHSTVEDHGEAIDRLQREFDVVFYHEDPVEDAADQQGGYLDHPETDLPVNLADSLQTWVWEHEDEIRPWLARVSS